MAEFLQCIQHCAAEGIQPLSSSLVIVAKNVIPFLLYYIFTLILEANWEKGPGES